MEKIERFRNTVLKKLAADGDDNRELIKIVEEAKIGVNWVADKTVMIGRARTLANFSTSIFHEAGHKVLGVGSTPEEEEMCHDFSRRTCERLNLPFDEELTNVCREFVKLTNEHSNNPEIFIRKIDSISIKHRRLLSIY